MDRAIFRRAISGRVILRRMVLKMAVSLGVRLRLLGAI
jgi:hypothetical protein